MFLISIFIIFWLQFGIRLLRYLSLFQQKEYRFDRLFSFFKTREGIVEFAKIIYFPKKISDIKRPRLTIRILILCFYCGVVYLFFTRYISNSIIVYCLMYILLPLWIFLFNIPLHFFIVILTTYWLKKASRKINSNNPYIIGITGSYGKTSTKLLLAKILTKKYSVFYTKGSINTPLGIAREVLKNYNQEQIVILEFAAYRQGEIARLARYFKPNMAIITGLNNQHLSLFGSFNKLIQAKSELLDALSKQGVIIYNAQNNNLIKMCQKRLQKTIAVKATNIFQDINMDMNGQLNFIWNKKIIKTKIIGDQYVENIGLALTAAVNLNLEQKEIIASLKNFVPNEYFIRLFRSKKTKAIVILDDRSSNFSGFIAALRILHQFQKPKKYLLFSGIVDLGKPSYSIHHRLAIAARSECQKIFYSGNLEKEAFIAVFKNDFVSDENKVHKALLELDNQSVLLIEGKIKPYLISSLLV